MHHPRTISMKHLESGDEGVFDDTAEGRAQAERLGYVLPEEYERMDGDEDPETDQEQAPEAPSLPEPTQDDAKEAAPVPAPAPAPAKRGPGRKKGKA